jgi:nucleotide-binding universal stress UspA family protein
MYDDILLPVDGATESSGVLHHASEIAHTMDATIRLLYVADTSRDSLTVVDTDVVDTLEREGRAIVEEAGETLDTLGAAYETDVVQGHPAVTIVEYAEEYGYDLVAMPTHGRSGLSRYLLGSVTEKVVRLSSVPVLTARIGDGGRLTFPYERILLPTDGSTGAARATEHALSLAASLDATVHALCAVEDADLGPDVRSTLSKRERESVASEILDDVVADADERGVETVTHVDRGAPDEAILSYVDEEDVHAVVMGTTGLHGIDRILLGSVAEKTVRSSPVPVITVRRE